MTPVGAPPTPAPVVPSRLAAVEDLLEDVAGLAESRGRSDLVARLEEARRRVARTEIVVCVVGEFKQGKSALINGLLGTAVCPVDDDLATVAVTVVRHGDQPTATVRRREPDGLVVESIAPEDLASWVTERANPENRRNVELVEISLPNPFLRHGLTLVDTPGVGGLNAAHAAATLAFLPLADALVFVTDASAELSGPEMDFLRSARSVGPPVIVGFTKTDMYPQWRRILEINEHRLAALDGDLRTYPLSAMLRAESIELADEELEAESGFPPFAHDLVGEVAERARIATAAVAVRDSASAIGQLREPLATELAALEHPEGTARLAGELERVRARLADLGEASSTWSVALDDEFAALRGRVEFLLHGQMRQILRDAHEEIEGIDPGQAWSELSERVQGRVASAVRDAFVATTDGASGIQATVAELLADEQVGLPEAEPVGLDVATMWQDGQAFGGGVRSGLVAGLALLTGATVGVDILAMLGGLLGTALVGPALLGATLFFGGKELLEERRRRLTDRRQEARSFIARFVENVQFEVDGRLAGLVGELQRQMRAGFTARIHELLRTTRESVEALEAGLERTEAERERRLTEVRSRLAGLEALRARAADSAILPPEDH